MAYLGNPSGNGQVLSVSGGVAAWATPSGVIPFNSSIDDITVSLLLHFTGTNGGTTFTDTGFYGYTFSNPSAPFSFATTSTLQSKYGGSSGRFNRASTQGLSTQLTAYFGGTAPFTLGTGDFTIETWVYLNSMPAGNSYPSSFWLLNWGNTNSADGFDWYIGSTNLMLSIANDYTKQIDIAHGMTTGQWYHVAISRQGTSFRLFINGVQTGSTTTSSQSAIAPNTGYLSVGIAEPFVSGGALDGFLQDMRVTKGLARYTANFTPPAAALPDAYLPNLLPSSPSVGQLASSTNALYVCTNATGPVWKRILL